MLKDSIKNAKWSNDIELYDILSTRKSLEGLMNDKEHKKLRKRFRSSSSKKRKKFKNKAESSYKNSQSSKADLRNTPSSSHRKNKRRGNEMMRRRAKQYQTASTASDSRKFNSKAGYSLLKKKRHGRSNSRSKKMTKKALEKAGVTLKQSTSMKLLNMNMIFQNQNEKSPTVNKMFKKRHGMLNRKKSIAALDKKMMIRYAKSGGKKLKNKKGLNDYSLCDLLTRKSSLNCFKKILKKKPFESPLTSLRQSK